MSKRIALFFDGTWNTPDSDTNVIRTQRLLEAIKSRSTVDGELESGQTNTFRLYTKMKAEAGYMVLFGEVIGIRPTGGETIRRRERRCLPQIKYYHSGVGTGNPIDELLGGMLGAGLSGNIRDAYLWLAENYDADDEIFLFGFSRGAFTARSFAGLVDCCGIMKKNLPELKTKAREAYRIYSQMPLDKTKADKFKMDYSHQNGRIKFIGVWDTVGALGVASLKTPLFKIPVRLPVIGRHNFEYHDTELKDSVDYAYHAMALDEHRRDFDVAVWSKPPSMAFEQCWFIGSHSNVGGGYPNDLLADIPLRWMLDKADACDLEFTREVCVPPDAYLGEIRDSYAEFLGGKYKMFSPRYFRKLVKGIDFHHTIQERMKDGGKNEQGQPYTIRNKP